MTAVADGVGRIVEDAILTNAAARVGELSLSDPWVGALRFAVECSDRPAELLEAILQPGGERDPSETRTRAILAALCITGQPGVPDKVAAAILAEFCAGIDYRDGQGTLGPSSLDRTALELARSPWSRTLRHVLIAEMKRRGSDDLEKVAGVCADVEAATMPIGEMSEQLDAWLHERVADLRSDHDEPEVVSACLAIMKLAWGRKIHEAPAELVEALFALLSGPPLEGFAAAWALWWLSQETTWRPSPDQIETMLDLLRKEETDQNMGRYLLVTVSAAGDERAVDLATRVLRAGDGPLVAAAIRVVGDLRPQAAVELVQPLLANPQNPGMGQAARLLGRVGDERGVPFLVRILRESPPGARRSAAVALGQIASADGVDPLIEALADPEAPAVRVASAEALGSIGDLKAVHPLLVRATDRSEDPDVRAAAIEALGEIQWHDDASLEAVVRLLDDEHPAISAAARSALARRPDPRARETLVEGVAAGRGEFEQSAVASLAMAGDDEVASLLRPIARDEDPYIRASAARMAGVVLEGRPDDSENAIGALVVGLLRDGDEGVCRVALAALPGRYPIPPAELEWLMEVDASPMRSTALLLRLEAAIREHDETAVHERLAEADIYAFGQAAGDTSVPGTGTEADLLHFTIDDVDGEGERVERVLLPVFTRPEITRAALLRNAEWMDLSVLQISGEDLVKNIDDDVNLVLNPWSDVEFILPAALEEHRYSGHLAERSHGLHGE